MIAIWGMSESHAHYTAKVMGLDLKAVVLMGNRSTGRARGRTFSTVLVLPGADPKHDAEVRPAVMSGAWVDLRDLRP